MLGSSTTNVENYSATLGAVNGSFDMNIKLTKVHKPQLLTLDNPNYATLLSKYNHLKGVKIDWPRFLAALILHSYLSRCFTVGRWSGARNMMCFF